MGMIFDELTSSEKSGANSVGFAVCVDGGKNLGSFARTGDAGDAEEMTATRDVLAEVGDGLFDEFGVFIESDLPFGFDVAGPMRLHVGDDSGEIGVFEGAGFAMGSGHGDLELIKVDFGKVAADVLGITVVDMLPSRFHALDFGFGIFVEVAKEGIFKFGGSGARKHAGNIHVRVAGASKTEIDDANHFVIFVE